MDENDKNIELLDSSVDIQNNTNVNHTNNSTISSVPAQNISNLDSFSKIPTIVGSTNNSSDTTKVFNDTSTGFDSSNANVNLEGFPSQANSALNSSTGSNLSLHSVQHTENHDFHDKDDEKKNFTNSSNTNNSKPTKPIVFLVIFIILLLVIIFLPYIGEFFDSLFPKKEDNVSYTGISSGSLVCTLEHENNGISYYYTDTYDFENRKIQNLQHVVSIQGGTDFLNQRNMECQTIKQTADSLPGISVDCNLSSGEMVETQYFDFSSLKNSDVSTAFIEAGGVYPNVKYGDNVSDVEKKLTISGYECRQS